MNNKETLDLKDYWDDENKVKKAEEIIREKKEKILKQELFEMEEKRKEKINENFKMNLKYKDYTKEENKEYKPKYLIIQLILNIALFSLSIIFDTFIFITIMWINLSILWIYALISIIKNDFKKENQKMIWIIVLIFIPIITPYIYPDFKEVQTI